MANRKRACPCGKDSNCPIHSKYKMQIIIHDDFKKNYKATEVWYNFLQEQSKPEHAIYNKMKDRIKKHFGAAAKSILWFHNTNEDDNLIRSEIL